MVSRTSPFRERLPFLGALWLALVTVLLCATVPAGLPGSEVRGSAFNPSNSVVALRAKAIASLHDAEIAVGKDDDGVTASHPGPHPGDQTIVPLTPMDGRPAIDAGRVLNILTWHDALPLLRLLSAIYPRGPPLF
ncbi:MAG TPA: hypothetical protein VF509_07210 [Sphingobium sp.]